MPRQAARLLRFSFQAFPGELTVGPRKRTGNAPGLKRKRLTTVALQSSGRVSEPFFGASLGGCLSGLAPEGDRPPHRGREGPGAARSSVSQSADFGRSCCKNGATARNVGLVFPPQCRPTGFRLDSLGVEGSARRRTPASSWS